MENNRIMALQGLGMSYSSNLLVKNILKKGYKVFIVNDFDKRKNKNG